MGMLAESLAAYAQPLLDETDGSLEQLNKAMSLAMYCYNLALLPEEERKESLGEIQKSFDMDDEEFDDLLQNVILPMIQRHYDMFPNMPRRGTQSSSRETDSLQKRVKETPLAKTHHGIGRNDLCPCNSGKKYKRCCGR